MYFYPFLLCNYATSSESKTLMSNFEPNEEYDAEIGQIKKRSRNGDNLHIPTDCSEEDGMYRSLPPICVSPPSSPG